MIVNHLHTSDPPCNIPHKERVPINGALICGSMSHHYPKVCRVHCREGYELRTYEPGHTFHCRWDGTWTLPEDESWPECYSKKNSALIKTVIRF